MFTAMEPKGAASVLEQLDDDEAARILGAVSERQAGKILEYLTPQRAAAVCRALLNSSRSTP
jgi:flagellar motility protein MotE (MotC chaperone)